MTNPPYDRWQFERRIYATPVPMRAKCVAFYLASRADRATGQWQIRAKTIARECGMGKNTAFEAIKDLEKAGLIIRIPKGTQNGRAANLYQLISSAESEIRTLRGSAESEIRTYPRPESGHHTTNPLTNPCPAESEIRTLRPRSPGPHKGSKHYRGNQTDPTAELSTGDEAASGGDADEEQATR